MQWAGADESIDSRCREVEEGGEKGEEGGEEKEKDELESRLKNLFGASETAVTLREVSLLPVLVLHYRS